MSEVNSDLIPGPQSFAGQVSWCMPKKRNFYKEFWQNSTNPTKLSAFSRQAYFKTVIVSDLKIRLQFYFLLPLIYAGLCLRGDQELRKIVLEMRAFCCLGNSFFPSLGTCWVRVNQFRLFWLCQVLSAPCVPPQKVLKAFYCVCPC